ncbi:MAG: right-handed parallel beta-helix repeat-containing protein, partial [Actinomycetota bacterium]|nr:right-handed parallel beta-helix repeat-containing protein [Actinomycetota bacterium]
VFSYNAAAGLSLRGNDVRAVSNTADHNGQIGIHAETANRLLLQSNLVAVNNLERFYPGAAAGGMKLNTSVDAVVRSNLAEANYGHGLWLDVQSDNGTLVRNVARRNQDAGIHFEFSDRALLAGNVSYDNAAGLLVSEASDVQLWNNTVWGNIISLAGYDGTRAPRPTNIVVRNNVLSADARSTRPMLLVEDVNKVRSWSDMRFSSNFNAYYRPSTVTTEYVSVLADYPSAKVYAKTLGQLQSQIGQERNGLIVEGARANPFVTNPTTGDFRLPDGSPAAGRGAPLPAAVAAALGVSAGVPVDIGADV